MISQRGPYWGGNVPDVINLHTCPHFRFWLRTESEGKSVDWWCHGRYCPSTALIDWSLPIIRKVYYKIAIIKMVIVMVTLSSIVLNFWPCTQLAILAVLKTVLKQGRNNSINGRRYVTRIDVILTSFLYLQWWISIVSEELNWVTPFAVHTSHTRYRKLLLFAVQRGNLLNNSICNTLPAQYL